MSNKQNVIITVAPTGTLSPKAVNPAVPTSPAEIAEDVYRCWKAGATVAHLHMRDDNDQGCMDKAKFKETVQRIRDKCDIIINLTSSGQPGATDEDRIEHIVEIKPEMATFDAGSFNWIPRDVFMNSPEFLHKLSIALRGSGVKPEFEIFHPGMYDVVNYYMHELNLLEGPGHYQFVLGVKGAMAATVENLLYLYNHLPANATWSAFGISSRHLPILMTTLALGGNIRVGLEDTGFFTKGVQATNLMLVERAARIVNEADKKVATVAEARKILGLA